VLLQLLCAALFLAAHKKLIFLENHYSGADCDLHVECTCLGPAMQTEQSGLPIKELPQIGSPSPVKSVPEPRKPQVGAGSRGSSHASPAAFTSFPLGDRI